MADWAIVHTFNEATHPASGSIKLQARVTYIHNSTFPGGVTVRDDVLTAALSDSDLENLCIVKSAVTGAVIAHGAANSYSIDSAHIIIPSLEKGYL